MKLKGRHFETMCDIKRELQWYLTALKKITSTVLLKRRKNYGIAVYVPKEIILKVMAAKIE
jgi:hypothetical protein